MKITTVIAASAMLAIGAPAVAQTATGTDGTTTTQPIEQDDDDGFPWGLLGLLGLAGLLPRKQKDHVHVDTTNRR
jgi:hypothetical protein